MTKEKKTPAAEAENIESAGKKKGRTFAFGDKKAKTAVGTVIDLRTKKQEDNAPKRKSKKASAPAAAPAPAAEVSAPAPAEKPVKAARKKGKKSAAQKAGSKLRIIPLGGLGEIGKNLTLFEYEDDIFAVDCGIAFPDDQMPGVDLVMPDITYLLKNADKFRGIVLTHGHEDHIGAVPYVLKQLGLQTPVYGTRLALGLVACKLEEHRIKPTMLREVSAGGEIRLGRAFSVEFIHSNHSIPDAVMLAIKSPVGTVIHTGDFKIDTSPILGEMIDLTRLGELGREGVLALLSDSTNSERGGMTMSERRVGETFESIFKTNDKRIVIATFSSNLHRVQQILSIADKYGRKVAVSGRSMINAIRVSSELGVLNVPKDLIVEIDQISKYPRDKQVIISTGSQGETMSALYRMAFSDHRNIELGSDDLVIISASAIPGNEKEIARVVSELMRRGSDVIYESLAEVHVSGHACQEEQKIVLALTKPKFFLPVHGEYKHLKRHATTAKTVGMDASNIIIGSIGSVIELDEESARIAGTVPSGQVLIDGIGVGDVGSIVLRDRKHLAEDGLIVVVASVSGDGNLLVAGPDIVSRGFVYVRESEELMEAARQKAKAAIEACLDRGDTDWAQLKSATRDAVSKFLYEKTKRSPMILPIVMEV